MTTPQSDQLIDELRANAVFAGFADDLLRPLTGNAIWREYAAGEVVVMEGDPDAGFYYVQYGWLKAIKLSQSGREQVLRFIEAGESFNEVGVFANRPIPATVVTLEPAGVWKIRQESLRQFLREQPDFAEQLVANLANRMLYLVSLVNDLSLLSVTGRLASLLVSQTTDDILHRPRWFTQAELASRLGTVPDVLQRVLRRMEEDGLIAVQRHMIRILDRDGLIKLAEQT